jgi:serine phosphatase RsbU (regulator of sigma subunit)
VTPFSTNYLRVFDDSATTVSTSEPRLYGGFEDLARSFEQATGWSLSYNSGKASDLDRDAMWSSPIGTGIAAPLGQMTLDLPKPVGNTVTTTRLDLETAGELAGSIAQLLGELLRTQQALAERDAELAAGVPVVMHPQEQEHLSSRLQSVLQNGAAAIGCCAASLYLLDENTTQLNLRSMWNLPRERYADPPRELSSANTDLEALCGHAVTLENTAVQSEWRLPEEYPAAICIPVSSPTVPLGTVWFFAHAPREFTDREVNVVEIVAGRLAADLEREMLLVANAGKTKTTRQLEAAERLQQNQLPCVAPLVEGWDIAGWTRQADYVGGDFYDWFLRADDRLLLSVADAMDGGFDAALCASGLRAALRTLSSQTLSPEQLLDQLNHALWAGSAGDQYAGIFCGLLDPTTGQILYASAGQPGALLIKPHDAQPIVGPTLALGVNPDSRYALYERWVSPGDVLVITSDGVLNAADRQGRPWGLAGVQQAIAEYLDWPARKLADLLRNRLETHAHAGASDDRTVLVVRRLPLR